MLLCLNCHTIVDRAPEEYSVEVLREWKASHELRIAEALGVVRYARREQARSALVRLLDDNRRIWELYGPESPRAWQPETSSVWFRNVRDVVLPNNSRILRILEVNYHLLTVAERPLVAEFSAHARALEQRHLGGVVDPSAPRFPPG
ncbi:hypothetical protein SF23_01180 [Streptomyces sp. MBRL 10]|nr:hypothetical protein SF23_01180 [Streptomyces sp. MBRL 10]